MKQSGLDPQAVKAWCDELRRSKARVAFMRDELPAVLAESGEAVTASLRADLDLLDLQAAILEAWITAADPLAWSGDASLNCGGTSCC